MLGYMSSNPEAYHTSEFLDDTAVTPFEYLWNIVPGLQGTLAANDVTIDIVKAESSLGEITSRSIGIYIYDKPQQHVTEDWREAYIVNEQGVQATVRHKAPLINELLEPQMELYGIPDTEALQIKHHRSAMLATFVRSQVTHNV